MIVPIRGTKPALSMQVSSILICELLMLHRSYNCMIIRVFGIRSMLPIRAARISTSIASILQIRKFNCMHTISSSKIQFEVYCPRSTENIDALQFFSIIFTLRRCCVRKCFSNSFFGADSNSHWNGQSNR